MPHTVIRRRALRCLASLVLSATALGAQAQEVKERTLRFGFSLAKDHPMGVGAQKFADLVAQRSGGKIKISIFPGAVLGSDLQNLSAVRGGTLDFTTMATGLLAGLNKEFMPAFPRWLSLKLIAGTNFCKIISGIRLMMGASNGSVCG